MKSPKLTFLWLGLLLLSKVAYCQDTPTSKFDTKANCPAWINWDKTKTAVNDSSLNSTIQYPLEDGELVHYVDGVAKLSTDLSVDADLNIGSLCTMLNGMGVMLQAQQQEIEQLKKEIAALKKQREATKQ